MRISIAGTGYVGLTSGVCFAEIGNEVCCYDIDPKKIELLNSGGIPIYEPGLKELLEKNRDKIRFTTDGRVAVEFGDVIFIGVGTPSREDGSVNLDYVDAVAEDIGKNMKSYKVIVNKSTVPVGTSERVAGIIRKHYSGDFDVVSNPEFLREGSAVKDFLEPDRIAIGCGSERARKVMLEVYGKMPPDVIFVTNPKSSELIKYASNTFLAFCISYVNGLVQSYPEHNIVELTGLFKDKLNPKAFFNVGVGFGGSCFPKDVREFTSFCTKVDGDAGLLREIIDVNEKQKLLFLDKLKKEAGPDATVCMLGLAFKPDTDDVREAPALAIASELLKMGCRIKAYDPVAMEEARKAIKEIEPCSDAYEAVKDADAVVLTTEWKEFSDLDLKKIRGLVKKPVFFDGRNVFSREKASGFSYFDVGRGNKNFSEEEKEEQLKAFLDKCDLFAAKLREVCEAVGADCNDVLKGMMLDKRIGENMFSTDSA